MSDQPVKVDIPAFEPTDAEVDTRAEELARAEGAEWPGADENRDRYRAIARERLQAERGLEIR